ncbi:MAG: hypothetical protein O3B09_02720 [Proteobacteria bacterium]|nr:hypothetical protein [Pseudomonadota bacterium]
MLLKILLKIWPSLIPLSLYILWIIFLELFILKKAKNKKDFIEGEYEEVDKAGQTNSRFGKPMVGHFSLKNPHFVITLYISLILMIISFLFFALQVPQIEEGKYVPTEFKDGKIIPAKIVE